MAARVIDMRSAVQQFVQNNIFLLVTSDGRLVNRKHVTLDELYDAIFIVAQGANGLFVWKDIWGPTGPILPRNANIRAGDRVWMYENLVKPKTTRV